MKPTAITVDDVIRFADEFSGKRLTTLAKEIPFAIRPDKSGVRYHLLRNGRNWPISRSRIQEYLNVYNASTPTDRRKTTIYPERFRERSYMVCILFEMTRNCDGDTDDGLIDLDIPVGNDMPDRAANSSFTVIRDSDVRRYVIKKAEGKCEYCKQEGFLMKNGQRYLEAHHIIGLAHQGKDSVENVIALCPEHHREAHYGAEAESLEKHLMRCVQERNHENHWAQPGGWS